VPGGEGLLVRVVLADLLCGWAVAAGSTSTATALRSPWPDRLNPRW